MRTSLVIETWNAAEDGPDVFARSLRCVHKQIRRPDEVILVDGGTPASAALRTTAATECPEARWVDAPGAGYYEQKNAGAAFAIGEAIAFLDSDMTVGDCWFGRVIGRIEEGWPVVTGATRYDDAPFARLFTLSVFAGYLVDRAGPVQFLIADNFAVLAGVWRAAKGFPPAGRRGGCRLLAAALRRAGHEVLCDPAVQARHHFDASPAHLLELQMQFGYSAWYSRRRDGSLPGGRVVRLGVAAPFLLAAGWFAKDLLRLPRAARRLGIPGALLPLYAVGLVCIRIVTFTAMMIATVRPDFFPRRYGW